MNDETCFPEVQYNELIQTKIINSIFDKISECSNEKEVKDKINDLLTEKSKLGLISLESLRDSDDFKDKIYKSNNKCFKYTPIPTKCSINVKTISFE